MNEKLNGIFSYLDIDDKTDIINKEYSDVLQRQDEGRNEVQSDNNVRRSCYQKGIKFKTCETRSGRHKTCMLA